MKTIQRGVRIVFGIQPLKPITNAPEGRQRLRMRPGSGAILYVKTNAGIQAFYLEDKGDHWVAKGHLGWNMTIYQGSGRVVHKSFNGAPVQMVKA